MKKITAAFDGLKYAESTRDYALNIAKQTNAHLVGIFLDDPTYTSYKVYDLISKDGVSEERLRKVAQKDKLVRASSAANFEQSCTQAGVQFTLHHDRKIAIHDLVHETIYSDLMVISAKETLTHYPENLPTRFIRELLSESQCPVLLVPDKYKPIQKIILLYDGAPSSVHAIKMFSYLLPVMKHLEVEVIAVNPMNSSLHLPDNKLMKEFMKRHYAKVIYTILKGWAEDEIIRYLHQISEDVLVVMGAYQRSTVSRWFRESMADILMKEVKFPLFIAHNK